MEQGAYLRETVARGAGQRDSVLVARGGGRVVAGQHMHKAVLDQGEGLARHVTEVIAHGCCLREARGGSLIVASPRLRPSKFGDRARLADPVPRLLRRGDGGPAQRHRLIHVTACTKELGHRCGYGDGMHGSPVA